MAEIVSRIPQISAILIGYFPYVLTPQKEALLYTTAIIQTVNNQAIIYNPPLRTDFDLSVETFKDLISHHVVSEIKEAGDPRKILELKEATDTPLHYFAG